MFTLAMRIAYTLSRQHVAWLQPAFPAPYALTGPP
jgi:hypothetical protein